MVGPSNHSAVFLFVCEDNLDQDHLGFPEPPGNIRSSIEDPLDYLFLAPLEGRSSSGPSWSAQDQVWVVSEDGLLTDASHVPGHAFQIQCFQCEEMKLDCSAPEHIVNCTVNVQDMCQKEVLVRADGQSGRKSASRRNTFLQEKNCGGFRTFVLMDFLCPHAGIHYRKSCASSGACLIASSGYQQFCTGRLDSVCIFCCNTPLCNGPLRRRAIPSTAAASSAQIATQLLVLLAIYAMPGLKVDEIL